jgi:hypothetical protein
MRAEQAIQNPKAQVDQSFLTRIPQSDRQGLKITIYEEFVEYRDGRTYLVPYILRRRAETIPLCAYTAMSRQVPLSELPGIEQLLKTAVQEKRGAA